MQMYLQQMLVFLSEVFQALLGLCLIGCQVHNKALERPILCLHSCGNVQMSLFLRDCHSICSILDIQSSAGPCNALMAFGCPEGV